MQAKSLVAAGSFNADDEGSDASTPEGADSDDETPRLARADAGARRTRADMAMAVGKRPSVVFAPPAPLHLAVPTPAHLLRRATDGESESEGEGARVPPSPSSSVASVSSQGEGEDEEKLAHDREQKRAWKWRMALRELEDTEEKYIAQLQYTKTVFHDPLVVDADNAPSGHAILGPAITQSLFSDIEIFLRLHRDQFLPAIHDAVSEEGEGIGAVFCERASFLKLYTSYINKYETNAQVIREEEKGNKRFKEYLAQCHGRRDIQQLTIHDFLIKPLHRLTRYKLLLGQLLSNHKPGDTKARDELQEAIAKLTAITSLVNERLRDADHRRKVVSISEDLKNAIPDLVQPARRYVCDVRLRLYTQEPSPSTAHVYVFSDIVVVAVEVDGLLGKTTRAHSFALSSLLLQLDVAPPASELHAFRLFRDVGNSNSGSGDGSVGLCTSDFTQYVSVTYALVERACLLECAPYPKHSGVRRKFPQFPNITVALIGDAQGGKLAFLSALWDMHAPLLANVFGANARARSHSRARPVAPGDAHEEFAVPFVHDAVPFNVSLLDCYSDERFSKDKKAKNRELWARADCVVYFVNLDNDYSPEYWASELKQAEKQVPVVVINYHAHRELATTSALKLVCSTLGASASGTCVGNNRQSVRGVLSVVVRHLKPAQQESSVLEAGMSLFGFRF